MVPLRAPAHLRFVVVLSCCVLLLAVLAARYAFAAQQTVAIAAFAFTPATLNIQAGDSVSWTNNDAAPHNVTAANDEWGSGRLATGATFTRTFTQSGSFDYLCTLHPSMRGNITVTAAEATRRVLFLPLLAEGGRAGTDTPPPAPISSPVPPTIANGTRWSDPASWPNNKLPEADEVVQIPPGITMLLDTSPPPLRGLQIDGALVFDRKELELTANWIMVHTGGRLEIGTATQPFTNTAVITLRGDDPSENIMGMGTKFLGAMGGTIDIHGAPRTAWTQLAATVEPGATQVPVLAANGWRVGDRIAIAPTDFDPFEAETRTIAAIDGTTLMLDRPLQYRHWGTIQALGSTNETMDQRAEVGMLSRNITVRGENVPGSTFGGHVMFMNGATTRLSNVEITGMGQLGKLGRYPIHWHFLGDQGKGSYLVDSSVHTNFQRGIVVHRTNDLVIRNNVVYDTVGHMVFLESSNELRNTFERNLVMLSRPVPIVARNPQIEFEHNLAFMERGIERISGFWISNAHNRFIGNHVVGMLHGSAYWFVEGSRSGSRDGDLDDVFRSPILEFRNNVAHTIGVDPRYGNDGMRPTGNALQIDGLVASPSTVQGLRAWKIAMYGFWGIPGVCCGPWGSVTLDRMVVADSKSAIFNGEIQVNTTVRDSVFYGMTDNQPPGVTATSRDWNALFAHQHPDDRTIEVVSLYPCSSELPPGPNNPCFKAKFAWIGNIIAGWPPR